MGYKLLGYVVWRAGKWYVRRRVSGAGRKAVAFAGVAAAVAGGVAVAQRASGSSDTPG